jgi:aspartyl-tRNA(Asn)/glutamyl-tRNA(Gln) amidotransferase subunit A
MNMSEQTAFLTVAELGAGYRDGSFTPLDVVKTAFARLARLEPLLNAIATPLHTAALAEAQQATALFAQGRDLGPLQGIPIAIKDLIEVQGVPTGFGSKVKPPAIAATDATLVRRLRAAGAVIFAKSNLLEYAYGVAHPAIGQTNNPYDPTRTAGGSSGGSAAAVAAGIVPLAIGTDTGGSIRIPAAYCGIVGLKPTYGLVPLQGVFPLSWSLDHAGPIARSPACAATLLASIAAQPMPLMPVDVAGLRVGIIRQHFPVSPEAAPLRDLVETAINALHQAGALFTEIDIPHLAEANAALVSILRPEASVIHQELLQLNPAGYAPHTLSQIKAGFALPATEYVQAMRLRTQLQHAVEGAFQSVDVLLSPSVPFTAPIEDPSIEDAGDSEILASGFANVTGHPSVSLPYGQIAGLPVGLQLTAAFGRDAWLLSLCDRLHHLNGHFGFHPPDFS